MSAQPAVLGGSPEFDDPIPIVQPVLPDYSALEGQIKEILASGMLTKGKQLEAFERAAAEHLNVDHTVAVSNCTTGLFLTYRALGLSGEVLVPSFTFMATVSSICLAGLRPVFVDVLRDSTNIDVEHCRTQATDQTSAVVAVHNFGAPADIEALENFTDEQGLDLVFDAAHGFGSLYQGRPVGSQGRVQVFSLSPTKLVIAGEGGLIATSDGDLARELRVAREYGNPGDYDCIFPSLNARMPEFNALLARESLGQLEGSVVRRNEIVARLKEELSDVPGLDFQTIRDGDRSAYKDLSITVETQAFGLNRDQLAQALRTEGIDTRKYYDPPAHRQTAYQKYCSDEERLQNTDLLAENSLSLPIWSNMPAETVGKIADAIRKIQDWNSEVSESLA